MSPNEVAGFVALGGGALVLTTQRAFNPAVPAIAAPVAVAWPHGAPALGAGVALGALTLARPRRLPGPALLLALALAILIAVTGDGGLVRGDAAAVAIAVVTPAFVRTIEDLLLAGVAFGLASACVALGAAVAGVGGVRADILAVAAAAGLAVSAATGARSIAAADLAGVLALSSKAGLVAAAVAIVGLLVVRRLPSIDAILAAVATGIAWLAGAPFAHAPWRHVSAFTDTYHRLGPAGVALFVLLLGATVWGLPRPYAPGLLAAAAGAIFVPLEATAPLWLLAGLAASSSSPEGPLYGAAEERRLLERAGELEAKRQALAEEQRRLGRRRQALDEREAELAGREPPVSRPAPPSPDDERRDGELAARERELEERARTLGELAERLRRRDEELAARERAVLEPAEPEDDAELVARERELEERARTLGELAQELRRRDEELAARERDAAEPAEPEEAPEEPQREPVVPEAAPPPPPPPEPEPEPEPEPVPVPAAEIPSPAADAVLQPELRHWNFAALGRLVEERAAEFPDRVEEWRIYLDTLEPYVEAGILPPAFDETVLDVFGPLVA